MMAKGSTRNLGFARAPIATGERVSTRTGDRTTGRPRPTAGTAADDAIALANNKGIDIIDIKFTDLIGTWQHFSITRDELTPDLFTQGIGFDGSSIRGFQTINESDMLVVPDPQSAIVDPICEVPTLSLVASVVDPTTGEPYSRDPRYIAQKAEAHLLKTGIADTSYWGPEIEFFVFDSVRFDYNDHAGFFEVDSDEGIWNSGRPNNGKPNLGFRPRHKEGYFPVPPTDSQQDLRSRIVQKLRQAGVRVEVHHHEVATAGQNEIDMRFGTLTRMGDQVQLYKYVVRNVARMHGKTVTFMPKPLFGDNGSGMHVHSSLWKNGTNLFYNAKGYALTSEMCRWYIGGLIKHGPALMALVAPTTNSYRRLVPGYEAPVNLAYSSRNRSAACRIPVYATSAASKRVEFRPPDPTANPYLAFSAMLMAGLDGIRNKIDPGEPLDENIYELPESEAKKVPTVPSSLGEALDALEKDHKFLLEGGVFTQDLLETWIAYKREKEVDPMRLRPHPYEYFLYYDF
jgi:glutamine synthetase